MFFSRVQINPQRREARKLLANPRAMHGAVEACFPPGSAAGTDGRSLWRVDADRHDVRLYVVSPLVPEMEHLVENAGWSSAPAETTDYERFLAGITKGQRYQFRVTVNPVKRQFVPGGRGKLLPHVTEEQQLRWFRERADRWGFAVAAMPAPDGGGTADRANRNLPALRSVRRRDQAFGKHDGERRRTVTQRQVTIDGELEVTDVGLLRDHLVGGMGRGKAYGCGLMTLARARRAP